MAQRYPSPGRHTLSGFFEQHITHNVLLPMPPVSEVLAPFGGYIEINEANTAFTGKLVDNDPHDGCAVIEGTIEGTKMRFTKRYGNPSRATQAPIHYDIITDWEGGGRGTYRIDGTDLTGRVFIWIHSEPELRPA